MLGLGVRVRSNIEQNGVLGFTGKALELPNPLRRVFLRRFETCAEVWGKLRMGRVRSLKKQKLVHQLPRAKREAKQQ